MKLQVLTGNDSLDFESGEQICTDRCCCHCDPYSVSLHSLVFCMEHCISLINSHFLPELSPTCGFMTDERAVRGASKILRQHQIYLQQLAYLPILDSCSQSTIYGQIENLRQMDNGPIYTQPILTNCRPN